MKVICWKYYLKVANLTKTYVFNIQKKYSFMVSKKDIVVLVNGLSATGKSVLCEKIANYFGLKYFPTSGILHALIEKELKKQKIAVKKNTGFWESEEGKIFFSERLRNGSFDKKVDEELLKKINRGGVVLDSWVMPWLSKKGYKIWLTASDKVRYKRAALRNRESITKTKKRIIEKEKKTACIYKKLYGFTWAKELAVFDLIINTDNLTEKEVFEKAKKAIEKDLLKKKK